VGDEAIREGIQRAQGDLGELRAWWYGRQNGVDGQNGVGGGCGAGPWLVVNAFAANDPESSFLSLDRVCRIEGVSADMCTGLLSLRSDRGDRTLQWADALADGGLDRFRRIFVAGVHARALQHRLRKTPGSERIETLRPGSPLEIMRHITGLQRCGLETTAAPTAAPGSAEAPSAGGLLFGFGNMGGLGESLVRHWQSVGEPHGA